MAFTDNKWSLIFTTMYRVEMSANDASDTAMFIASDRCTDCYNYKQMQMFLEMITWPFNPISKFLL